jgi:putative membrane protein
VVASVVAGLPAVGNDCTDARKEGMSMRDLTRQLLSDADRAAITAAVEAAEKKTTGEIVPMVVSSSYHYPMADVIGGASLALPVALLLTPLIGGWFWIGTWNLWVFLGLFCALFLSGLMIVRHSLGIKRFFISNREIDEEVQEAAVTSFFKNGIHRTREETGVLVFISLFERRVWVLADQGINREVAQDQWDGIVASIVEGIKQKRAGNAICKAVADVGNLLAVHFPIREDDRDELANLIVEK